MGTGRITIDTGSYDASNNPSNASGTTKTIDVNASNGANGTLNDVTQKPAATGATNVTVTRNF